MNPSIGIGMNATTPHSGSPMAGLQVLVVEDSDVQRAHAVALVEAMGAARIWEAADGEEGLAVLARETGIDLVLSDLEMPRMDGVAFIGELAARGFRPRVVIVSSQESEVLRAVRLMAETYGLTLPGVIPKPLSRGALTRLLAEAPLFTASRPVPVVQVEKRKPGREDIRRGISANEFLCFFQPQITLQGAVLHGVEALVRWRHPVFGLLGPAAFLPQAEAEEELMSDLTMRILEQVAEAWHAWNRRGLHLDVSVNLSARSLGVSGFADRLLETTKCLDLPSKSIVFEVTESASVANLGHGLANLARLRMRGFKLSIDDFGTGFATFEQLERFPFTELKIDQSITAMLPLAARQMSMAHRMIQLAQDLKLSVVAEGIETLEAWRAIRDLGCETGQGYFIARPMPGDQVPEWAMVDRSHLREQALG